VQVARDPAGPAADVGDRSELVPRHQFGESGEHRPVPRHPVQRVGELAGVVGGDGVVRRPRDGQVVALRHEQDCARTAFHRRSANATKPVLCEIDLEPVCPWRRPSRRPPCSSLVRTQKMWLVLSLVRSPGIGQTDRSSGVNPPGTPEWRLPVPRPPTSGQGIRVVQRDTCLCHLPQSMRWSVTGAAGPTSRICHRSRFYYCDRSASGWAAAVRTSSRTGASSRDA